MATVNKYYTVIAGRKEPVKVLQGTLSKGTGLPNSGAQTIKMFVGKVMIPNYSAIWGRRKSTDGKSEVKSVSDKNYVGVIEPLEWGDSKGELIEIRYLRNSKSHDKQYQDTVQKLRVSDEDVFIVLEQGVNNFDEDKQGTLVWMLKHHGLMLDNKSRNTENTDYDIIAYDPKTKNESRVKAINIKNTAEGIVLGATNSVARVAIIAAICNLDVKEQAEVLVEKMLDKVEEDAAAFLNTIIKYQTQVIADFEDAVKSDIVVREEDQLLYNKRTGGKHKLLSDVEGKGNDVYKWLSEQVLESEKVYEAYEIVKKELKEYRMQFV